MHKDLPNLKTDFTAYFLFYQKKKRTRKINDPTLNRKHHVKKIAFALSFFYDAFFNVVVIFIFYKNYGTA
jgi:hypothetical protein